MPLRKKAAATVTPDRGRSQMRSRPYRCQRGVATPDLDRNPDVYEEWCNMHDSKSRNARIQTSAVDLQHLRYAVAAADHGSFRRAAEALVLRQSTLSRCIRRLEECLKITVFERSSGGSTGHPSGARLPSNGPVHSRTDGHAGNRRARRRPRRSSSVNGRIGADAVTS